MAIIINPISIVQASSPTPSGYAVSCSYYNNTTPNHYQYSIDNGSTWTDITATGSLGTFTQIKFRIVDDIESGTGAILSTKLGMTLKLEDASRPGASVESQNYTLTEAIDDIGCYEMTPSQSYTLTVQYGGTDSGDHDATIWFKTNSAPISDSDRTVGANSAGLVNAEGYLIQSPQIFNNVTKIYYWKDRGSYSYINVNNIEDHSLYNHASGYANAIEITLTGNTTIKTYPEIDG